MEKYDGYILKLYWYDGAWRVATNSEVELCVIGEEKLESKLESSAAEKLESKLELSAAEKDEGDVILRNSKRSAREIFLECAAEEKLDYRRLKKTNVYILEMMHPECRIVVPCHSASPRGMLIHLMTRDMLTLRELPLSHKDHDIGLRHPRSHLELDTREKRLAYVNELHWSQGEGLVEYSILPTGEVSRKKIKGKSYMREHKLLEVHGEKKVEYLREYLVDKWLEEEGELIYFYYPELKVSFDRLVKVIDDLVSSVIMAKRTIGSAASFAHASDPVTAESFAHTFTAGSKKLQNAFIHLQKQTFSLEGPITMDALKKILRKKKSAGESFVHKKMLIELPW